MYLCQFSQNMAIGSEDSNGSQIKSADKRHPVAMSTESSPKQHVPPPLHVKN